MMHFNRLSELFTRISHASVGVVGDFCLDAYWQLDTQEPELSLETGKETLAVSSQRYSLGGAGNVMSNIAALGVRQPHVYGVVAVDVFGQEMLRQMQTLRVEASGLIRQEADWQTSVYAKPYRGREEQNRIDFGRFNTLSPASERQLIASLTEGITKLDALVVNQQLSKSIFTSAVIDTLNSLAQQYPQKVFLVDSRHRIPDFRSMISKLNAIEAAHLFGKTFGKNELVSTEDLRLYAMHFFGQFGKPVFITRSRLGIFLFDGKETTEIPSINVKEPIDPVGAGDTVVAALSCALAAGANPREAATLAILAAAITVRKLLQTGTATPQEILNLANSLPHVPL